jgi:hypothetical protein
MRDRDPRHEREAETERLMRRARAMLAAIEGVEDALDLRGVEAMAAVEHGEHDLARALGRRIPQGLVRVVDNHSTLAEGEYGSPPVLFKRSSLDHGGVSRYYPRHVIAAAGFPALRQ